MPRPRRGRRRAPRAVRSLSFLLPLSVLLGASHGRGSEGDGPFPLRILHPLTVPLFQPLPDAAATAPRGDLRAAVVSQYGSTQKLEQSGRSSAIYDGEFHRLGLSFRYGLLDRLEAHVEVPFYTRGGGFLDGFIKDYHNVTGLVRDDRSSDRFDEVAVVDGSTVIDNDSVGFRPMDVPVQLKYLILDGGRLPFRLAARGSLEIPVGDESDWIGNGGLDGGLGLLLDHEAGDLSFHLNFDWRFLSTPRRFRSRGIGFQAVPAGMAAVEWRLFERLALLAQIGATQSVFDEDTGLDTFDNPQVVLHLGARFRLLDRLRGFAGITEDLVRAATPDVVFFFGLEAQLRQGKGGAP